MGEGATWEPLLKRSIDAFYAGDLDAGRLACDQLLNMPDLPDAVRALTRTNQVHYAPPLSDWASSLREEPDAAPAELESISPPLPFDVESQAPQTAASRALLQAAAYGQDVDWIAATIGDEHYLVHLRGATTAVHREAATGALRLAACNDAPFVTKELRGLARLVTISDGLLALLHEAVIWGDGEQSHLYRFARLDCSFQIIGLSHPFRIDASSREQVTRLTADHDRLVVISTIMERAAPRLHSLDIAEALALLHPLDLLAPAGLHPFPMPNGLLAALQGSAPPVVPEPMAANAEEIPVLRPETIIAALPSANPVSQAPLLRQFLYSDTSPYHDFPMADHPADLQGWSANNPMIECAIRERRPRRIIEVGTWKGASAIAMARYCQHINAPCEEIVCVDTWLGGPENVIEVGARGEVIRSPWFAHLRHKHGYPQLYFTFLRNVLDAGVADLITPLPLSSDSAATVLERYGFVADLVYIDAGHEYESVRGDLRRFWKLVAPGGILLGDDYANPEHAGVRRAVDEFCAEIGLPLTADALTFAIEKPSQS